MWVIFNIIEIESPLNQCSIKGTILTTLLCTCYLLLFWTEVFLMADRAVKYNSIIQCWHVKNSLVCVYVFLNERPQHRNGPQDNSLQREVWRWPLTEHTPGHTATRMTSDRTHSRTHGNTGIIVSFVVLTLAPKGKFFLPQSFEFLPSQHHRCVASDNNIVVVTHQQQLARERRRKKTKGQGQYFSEEPVKKTILLLLPVPRSKRFTIREVWGTRDAMESLNQPRAEFCSL